MPATGMDRLRRWLARRVARAEGRPTVEGALLTGRFGVYLRRRLIPFFANRLVALTAHVIEFTILLNLFLQRGLVTSLVVRNASLVVDAFFWGALEPMRERIRRGPAPEAAAELQRWLTRSVRLALAVVLLPTALVAWRWIARGLPPTPLEGFVLACAFRLAVDAVLRTFYSGVYAVARVYRPLAFIAFVDLAGLLAVLFLWNEIYWWCFPAAIVATVLVSRPIGFLYTLRAYRRLRVPLPRLRLRAPRRPSPDPARKVLLAGAARLSSEVGVVFVLGALLRVSLTSEALDPFTFLLHLITPIVGGAAGWGRVFYHDWKQLAAPACAALRRRLERLLWPSALAVGALLWGAGFLVAWLFLDWRGMVPQLLSLLPLLVALSLLSARQLRDFALGAHGRLVGASVALVALVLLADGAGAHLPAAGWDLLLAGLVGAGALLLWPRPIARQHGLLGGPLELMGALAAVEGEVCVGGGRPGERGRARALAERLADFLGPRGAVALLPDRRLVWFERAPARLGLPQLVALSAGTLRGARILPPTSADRALDAAGAAGLLPAPRAGMATSAVELAAEFTRLHPDGRVVAIDDGAALAHLGVHGSRRVWREAVRGVTRGRPGRRLTHEVTSYHPQGAVTHVFLTPRDADRERRLAWRRTVLDASRHATWVAARAKAGVTSGSMHKKPGLFTRLQRWAALLLLGACGTVAGGADAGGDGPPMDGSAGIDSSQPPPAFSTTWPDPTGAMDEAGSPVLLRLESTGIPGTIYECRTDHDSVFTPTTPAWAPCDGGSGMNPTHQPALPTGITEGGRFRTEYRYRLSTGFTSAAVEYTFYLHNSLSGRSTCALPRTDEEYFAFARNFDALAFPTINTFPTDATAPQLRNPHIRILFRGATASEGARTSGFFLDGNAARFPATGTLGTAPFDYPFGVDSLRHKYVLSADNSMILMRRFYEGHDGSCRQSLRVSGNQGVQAPHGVTCDAWVVNSRGQGMCLAGSTIAAVAFDQFIPPGVGAFRTGTISGAAGSATITGMATTFDASWVGCHLRLGYRWHRVATFTTPTLLALADPLPSSIMTQPFLYCGAVEDVFISPTGYIKLRNDDRPGAGAFTPDRTSRNKCVDDPGCNGTDPSRVFYLPP